MSRKIDIIVANPAGNTTVFVLTPVLPNEYREITDKLLEIDFGKEYGVKFTCPDSDSVMGEQVGFVLPEADEGVPAFNMSGLEFCGNASRAFAYYQVSHLGGGTVLEDGSRSLQIKASGCNHPLTARIDAKANFAEIEMPLPVNITKFSGEELGLANENPDLVDCFLIDMDGISHLILDNITAAPEKFNRIRKYVYDKAGDMDAFGVMFIDRTTDYVTPVVYVRDVNTTYFEGSCASGTAAAAFVR
ncbi:MAG: hypothetical protein Q4C46_12665, partial [Bacillota bacterium]|nr:hypothetical protein [Bacillota bacterium]